ncbi:SPRY-domain-containing protein [Gigaspora margarita]|uniref:SPRY-domain-containing protein n=1 Tax=Gigaspora margarita TaxID=4874 RepID=A0A8H4AKM5_GIGMA|nr:SPRY-domain-containing protein [Gigaspora margarita]
MPKLTKLPKIRIIRGKNKKRKIKKSKPLLPDYLNDSPLDIHNNVAKCPILIPTCWNVNDCSPGLRIYDNLLSVKNNGSREIAAVRANNYIPRETGIYYFEVDILECEDDLVISVGVSASYTCLDRLAGWDPGSIGYHSDNGWKYLEYGHGLKYGPTFTAGDTIGCCINFYSNEIFFTKNGVNLGSVCKSKIINQLYPAIGMGGMNSWIEANFGNKPFKFDIKLYAKTFKSQNGFLIL